LYLYSVNESLYTLADLRRAVEALPSGASVTLPREALLQAIGDGDVGAQPDGMLTPDEAARLLRTDRRWIYRHAQELGAVHLTRRKMRIPHAAIQRYLKRKRG